MPPESPISDVGEPVLAHVVARAEHERFVDLVHRLERRFDARRDARVGRTAVRRPGSPAAATPRPDRADRAGACGTRAARRCRRSSRSVTNCLARAIERSLLVEHERRAVEHQLVLAADEVRVDDRHRRVGRARREHRLALDEPLRVVRRRVEVDDELRAARRLGEDRSGRAPRVFADRDADLHARDVEQRQRLARRDEVALLVEDGVVRQQLLAVDAVHAAVRADRRRVVQIATRFGETDDRRGPRRARRDLVERLDRLRDERGPQEEVFGRVAR